MSKAFLDLDSMGENLRIIFICVSLSKKSRHTASCFNGYNPNSAATVLLLDNNMFENTGEGVLQIR